MYQLIQRRDLSASHTPLLLIVIVTTLLTIPGFAWPSEDPTHSSQYDQLKDSITALSGEVNSIASIIGTLKEQARTPQTAPQGYDHLRKTIQDLTEKITGLTRIINSLAQNISKEKPQDLNNTGTLQPAITNLSANVTLLGAHVAFLTTQVATIRGINNDQETDWHKAWIALIGAICGGVIALATGYWKLKWLDEPKQKQERAKEKLEKFYAPVLGRLQANEDIWNNFTFTLFGTTDLFTSQQALISILNDDRTRNESLDKWVATMEGIFRQNNEAAEETILENYGYLRPEDVKEGSAFDNERKKYLMHVGEFKATLLHWEQAKKTIPQSPGMTDAVNHQTST